MIAVDGNVAAGGRRLPKRRFEHNTLLGGQLDLAIDLAAAIRNAMTHTINDGPAQALWTCPAFVD